MPVTVSKRYVFEMKNKQSHCLDGPGHTHQIEYESKGSRDNFVLDGMGHRTGYTHRSDIPGHENGDDDRHEHET